MSIYKKIIDSTSGSNHYSRLSSQSTLNSLDTMNPNNNQQQFKEPSTRNNNNYLSLTNDCCANTNATHIINCNNNNNSSQNKFNGIFTSSLSSSESQTQQLNDPVLKKWLKETRFEVDVECCAYLIHRTVAFDKCSLDALSIRNSHLIIQLMRNQSQKILQSIDDLIDQLPLALQDVEIFAEQFSNIWRKIDQLSRHSTLIPSGHGNEQIAVNINSNNSPILTMNGSGNNHLRNQQQTNHFYNRSPDTKNMVAKPLDATRRLCLQFAKLLQRYQEPHYSQGIHNATIESYLRKIKETFGNLIDICIRIECNEIVKALKTQYTTNKAITIKDNNTKALIVSNNSNCDYSSVQQDYHHCNNDFAFNQHYTNNQTPSPLYNGSSGYGGYSCADCGHDLDYPPTNQHVINNDLMSSQHRLAQSNNTCYCNEENINRINNNNGRYRMKRSDSDYYTDDSSKQLEPVQPFASAKTQLSLKWALIALWQLTKDDSYICKILVEKPFKVSNIRNNLSCLKEPSSLDYSTKNVNLKTPEQPTTTIERLLDIIVNQPNKHERIDLMSYMHEQAKNNKLIDLDEIDQSVDAAIYTSNQFKVAALVILNHLCVNDKAVKTILKCLSTPPPSHDCPQPENRIIKSIFGDYNSNKNKMMHIYQNQAAITKQRNKRKRHDSDQTKILDEGVEDDHNPHYQTVFDETNDRNYNEEDTDDESDDAVVREAVRLLVQLTVPFIDDGKKQDYYSLIGRDSIELIIKHLTNIIKSTKKKDMILLAAATLAHISFVSIEPIVKYETNELLLKTINNSKSIILDLDIRDQLVTILANTASKYPLEVVSSGGLIFLLSSLQSCPLKMAKFSPRPSKRSQECENSNLSGHNTTLDNRARRRNPIACSELNDDADVLIHSDCEQDHTGRSCIKNMDPKILSIFERIHQKAIVALARLSANKSAAHLIAKLGGIKRMIELCHDSDQRNHSDSVLKACIAALRVMAKAIGSTHPFEFYHALDLIELDFDKAFAIYKTPQNESQV